MNPFLHLLKAAGAHPPVGTCVASANALVAEAIACAGFDWALFDMLHAPLDASSVLHLLQAVATTRLVPVVRVPSGPGPGDVGCVQRVLDAGACTLLFPHIETAEQAKQAVAATRHPPFGHRAVTEMSRATRFGTAPQPYKQAAAQTGVIVQLDSLAALVQLEAIAAVDGVIALFIEPATLAASMDHGGQSAHAAVLDRMSQAASRAQAVGRPIGAIGHSPGVVAQYRAAGFHFVAVGSDLGLMMQGAHAAIGALRTQDREHVHTLAGGTRSGQ